jgi:hypothetical protein
MLTKISFKIFGLVSRNWGGRGEGRGNAIPITDCGRPQCCETLRLPHYVYLENTIPR